jgi:hypothetical protein
VVSKRGLVLIGCLVFFVLPCLIFVLAAPFLLHLLLRH